jgi:hypothetical protein
LCAKKFETPDTVILFIVYNVQDSAVPSILTLRVNNSCDMLLIQF